MNLHLLTRPPLILAMAPGEDGFPGRYFAGLTIKMMMVKLLTEYDWRFKEGSARPKNHLVHEFLFPWPWDKVQLRRREKPTCPF